tara:strand:- start:3338 stop:3613 length:276 start_codon:yes stop_codon:yes gene_type:complete
MKIVRISVDMCGLSQGAPICCSKHCPERRECANHESAGMYREESGFSPNLSWEDDVWMCDQKATNVRGMLYFSPKTGKLIAYLGPYEDDKG